jgi:hypothetical protein
LPSPIPFPLLRHLGDGVSLETIHLITRERLEAHPRVDDFSAPNVAAYPERVSALYPERVVVSPAYW